MTNISVVESVFKVNDFEGELSEIERIDDDFIHIVLSGIAVGITPSATTINDTLYESTDLFITALNEYAGH